MRCGAEPVPRHANGTPCERIAWRIVLAPGEPARFKLHAPFGIQQPNSAGFENGGAAVELAGTWSRGPRAR